MKSRYRMRMIYNFLPNRSRLGKVAICCWHFDIFSGLPVRRVCGVALCLCQGYSAPDCKAFCCIEEVFGTGLLVSSKEQKILGLSNHRTGDYSFPINAANTSSNFHLILICSASYTRTCSTKIRSSSLVSVFASLY